MDLTLNQTPNFDNIDYLKTGNYRQQKAFLALTENKILDQLTDFEPILTGTIPINIDVPTSDLDIICFWKNKEKFINWLTESFKHEPDFNLRETKINAEETIIANFILADFEIEIFGQHIPTKEQNAYRHLLIEYQILAEKGEEFRQQIIDLKLQGYKTEPAFAQLLGLSGNPYTALLNYQL